MGQKIPTKKNLRHLRNLRDKKKQEHISGASHWPEAKYPRKSVSNPISKIASDSSVKSDEEKFDDEKSMKKRDLYPPLGLKLAKRVVGSI